MKKKGEVFWYPAQDNKMRFFPRRATVLENGMDTIAVNAEVASVQDGIVLVKPKRTFLDESKLFDAETHCRQKCIELMRARRSAFLAEHGSNMRAVDATLRELEGL